MGNPVPKLLIENCWFENVWHQKLKDRMGGKVGYIKASFDLCDESIGGDRTRQFPGLWWGHYKDDLPPGRWDVIAELDYNSHPKSRRYEIRLVDIRPTVAATADGAASSQRSARLANGAGWLLDWRTPEDSVRTSETDLILSDCPTRWQELSLWRHQADQMRQPLALAYPAPAEVDPIYKWKMLLGLAKYLSREQLAATPERLGEKLDVSDRTLSLGLSALAQHGFIVKRSAIDIRFQFRSEHTPGQTELLDPSEQQALSDETLGRFLSAVQEEQFRRQYFYRAPVGTLEGAIRTEMAGKY